MNERTWWFSSMVEFALHVQDEDAYQVVKSVVLVRAKDFDQAKRRVVAASRTRETSYLNEDGHLVQWVLKRVVTIDWLDSRLASGREVYSEPSEMEVLPEGGLAFAPDLSEWGSCGV